MLPGNCKFLYFLHFSLDKAIEQEYNYSKDYATPSEENLNVYQGLEKRHLYNSKSVEYVPLARENIFINSDPIALVYALVFSPFELMRGARIRA